MILLN